MWKNPRLLINSFILYFSNTNPITWTNVNKTFKVLLNWTHDSARCRCHVIFTDIIFSSIVSRLKILKCIPRTVTSQVHHLKHYLQLIGLIMIGLTVLLAYYFLLNFNTGLLKLISATAAFGLTPASLQINRKHSFKNKCTDLNFNRALLV